MAGRPAPDRTRPTRQYTTADALDALDALDAPMHMRLRDAALRAAPPALYRCGLRTPLLGTTRPPSRSSTKNEALAAELDADAAKAKRGQARRRKDQARGRA
ncbi:hypothetical protein THAOC_04951 [Thalassiosira oceanica]|uniref:Uncharacterized protein n=1 Tax=Thalassiosira oceanica TaxID=159749 RepID=K0T8I3_THAOC|nr:hypothetical protein THAOC_04951 [Thalassiosira oceanica]|eukprot:EJK73424.1 hypothetical protein THAOC_04951 [Thalassiosira oceanica]